MTALVLVKAGSRWETRNINGISHFLEHMFFKGAERFATPRSVSEAIDGVGGDFNAFTGKEYAGYYVKVSAAHKRLAVDVLGDMMLNARFDQEEIEKERGVIMEEFNMYQDTPMYQVAWNFERALFGDQPLGWDEVGTKDVIMALQREDFVAYKEALYVPENMVFVMSGNVTHEEAEALASEFLMMDGVPVNREMKAYESGHGSGEKVQLQKKKTEQTHLVCGVEGVAAGHADHYVQKVLAAILGGGMSSRMFQVVREERGLAYYISTGSEHYLDTGNLYTRAGVSVDRAAEAVSAIVGEYKRIAADLVPAEELAKAKEFLKGKLVLSLEDSEYVAQLLSRHDLLYGEVKTYEDIAALIDAVTAEDVQRLAGELLTAEALHLSVIGPYEGVEDFEKTLSVV